MRFSLSLIAILTVVCAAGLARAQNDSLSLSFDTAPLGGEYSPANVVAVWVEDDGGNFVKTIGRWSAARTIHLVGWVAASGQDTDAVSGATRSTHDQSLTVTWSLEDTGGTLVPDGTYTIHIETCESNTADGQGSNTVAKFTFEKDGLYRSETDLSDANVSGGTLDYLQATSSGETCISDGVCETECATPDPDCQEGEPAPGTGSGSGETSSVVRGGCAAGGGDGSSRYLVGLLVAAFGILRRRRRAP